MRTALIVDGKAEYHSLPYLYRRLDDRQHQIVDIAKADLQPGSPVGQIRRLIRSTIVNSFVHKKVEHVVVLIDLDKREACAATWATTLLREVQELERSLPCSILPVVKVDRYENWLISDISAMRRAMGGINPSEPVMRRIAAGADSVDADQILRTLAGNIGRNRRYDKVDDSIRIMKIANPMVIAKNSRSFRRFLRTINCHSYRTQSKVPL